MNLATGFFFVIYPRIPFVQRHIFAIQLFEALGEWVPGKVQ